MFYFCSETTDHRLHNLRNAGSRKINVIFPDIFSDIAFARVTKAVRLLSFRKRVWGDGARSGTRTRMEWPPRDFKSLVSTDFTIRAGWTGRYATARHLQSTLFPESDAQKRLQRRHGGRAQSSVASQRLNLNSIDV